MSTTSKVVLLRMLVKRIKHLRWDIERMNYILGLFRTEKEAALKGPVRDWRNRALAHKLDKTPLGMIPQFNFELLHKMDISNLDSIPIIDLNTRSAITGACMVLNDRVAIHTQLISIFFNPKKHYACRSTIAFQKVYDNSVFEESMIPRAWELMLIEDVHKS